MPRPSSIKKLPVEIQELIGKLRMRGWTIDQILEELSGMLDKMPSRSALGRHIHGMDAIADKMRRSRAVAEALVQQLGDAPESRTARLNIELLHSAVLDLFMKAADDANDPSIAIGGKLALAGDPEGAMMLAKTLESLAKASKYNQDYIVSVEKAAIARGKIEAMEAVETVAKDKAAGISAETLATIKASIFGVKG